MGGLVTLAIELYKTSSLFAFAVNMVASAIISKVFAPTPPELGQQSNPGSKQQLPPSGSNKIPVIYGNAWTGGMITDLTISDNNKDIYWVIALSEVTNTESGVSTGSADDINFGEIYWGGKRCLFQTSKNTTSNPSSKNGKQPTKNNGGGSVDYTEVIGLQDTSTGEIIDLSNDNGYLMNIYLYSNGSDAPYNTELKAYEVLSNATNPQSATLIYEWDSSKKMTNTVFAIVHLHYNTDTGMTGLQQTRFQVINSRSSPGDCFMDYLQSTRYGAGIYSYQIDTNSFNELNNYSNQVINYTDYAGNVQSQKRYEFNGTLETNQKLMTNIQTMSDCCNSLIRYNEILSMWGVVLQTPYYDVAMALNDSNIIGPLVISPIDLSNSFNIIEVAFADNTEKDTFTTANFDLAVINPSLLFPNEPVNKQSVQLNLVNNSVQAQYIANQMLEGAREDLQVQCEINYYGLQLQAGDIVTLSNTNYGFVNKLFRIIKVTQKFNDKGQITAQLSLTEYNPTVFDNKNVTQFTPAPNTGIGSPLAFGTVPVPIVSATNPSALTPYITVQVTTPNGGITQYAEVWYSAYQYPTASQYIFAGISEISPSGNTYSNNFKLPDIQLTTIPSGNWYIFTRMVNGLGKSSYSSASDLVQWRPTTLQYTQEYVVIAYANDVNGTGLSFSPTNKTYFGLYNSNSTTAPTDPTLYKWFSVSLTSSGAYTDFGTTRFIAYINRGSRLFSFNVDTQTYIATDKYVPSTTALFDPKLWSSLSSALNYIDLDVSTGQLIRVGNTSSNAGTGQLSITNDPTGQIIASLDQFLDFGGPTTKTANASTLTIDIFGRVVGFAAPDDFNFTYETFTATSGQTVFTPATRSAYYITGQDLIFKNGALLSTSDYTETSTTFTLGVGATTGDIITCISMSAKSGSKAYIDANINVSSVATNVVTWDSATMPYQLIPVGQEMTFSNVGTPTVYTVTAVNYTTRQITFSTSVTAFAGNHIYFHRNSNSAYAPFSRFEFDLINQSTYTPTTWNLASGYEIPYINGAILADADYDIVSGSLTNFPSSTTGKVIYLQFADNNLTVPAGNPVNVPTNAVIGQTAYNFAFTTNAFDLYSNGVLLKDSTDYTTSTGTYTLANSPTTTLQLLLQQTFSRTGSA